MAKAFWLFSRNAGDGSEDNENRPALPAGVGGKWTMPGDIVALTGPAALPHRHLLVGGIALPDDGLGDGHRHYVVKTALSWTQVTVGAVDHAHDLDLGAVGAMPIPDFYLLFWAGTNADAAAIAADPNCWPVVEAEMEQDDEGNWSIGDLKSGWATEDQVWWESRILAVLGIQMPVEVTSGKRLVRLFLGALLSRQTGDERGYRFTS